MNFLLTAMAVLTLHGAPRDSVAVELPVPALREIAADFDQGKNPLYCYFGRRLTTPILLVRVDSVVVVDHATDCRGIGLGFISRISDAAFLGQALRGVIDASPAFAVVTAFYRTEEIEQDGFRFRAPRAFSVVRGVAPRAANTSG